MSRGHLWLDFACWWVRVLSGNVAILLVCVIDLWFSHSIFLSLGFAG